MELNQIIRDIEEVDKVEKVTEVIEDIEEIAQRLASLHVSMRILATHCLVINTLSTDEFKTLKINSAIKIQQYLIEVFGIMLEM